MTQNTLFVKKMTENTIFYGIYRDSDIANMKSFLLFDSGSNPLFVRSYIEDA